MSEEPKEELVKSNDLDAIKQLLFYGDLSALSQEEKGKYLFALCNSLGVNPWTKPFDFLPINGKLVLYANKGAAAQLAEVKQITSELLYEGPLRMGPDAYMKEIYQVTMKFTDPSTRVSYETGTVWIGGLSGEAASNRAMVAWTKCKRRGILSHAGLGFPDESELDSIPEVRARQQSPRIIQPALAPAELVDTIPEPTVTPEVLPPAKAPLPPKITKPASNGPPRVIPAAKPPVKRV
jgi:hypothetical protein